MSDIDWEERHDATHWEEETEERFAGFSRLVDGRFHDWANVKNEWLVVVDQDEIGPSIPRPAKHRDWSDPAMWFDAPEWATVVALSGEDYFYLSKFEIGGFHCKVGSQPVNEFIEINVLVGEIIATRPTAAATDQLTEINEQMVGEMKTEKYKSAAEQLRQRADDLMTEIISLNKAADYLESLK